MISVRMRSLICTILTEYTDSEKDDLIRKYTRHTRYVKAGIWHTSRYSVFILQQWLRRDRLSMRAYDCNSRHKLDIFLKRYNNSLFSSRSICFCSGRRTRSYYCNPGQPFLEFGTLPWWSCQSFAIRADKKGESLVQVHAVKLTIH
jgi:hypothetical protein